MKTSLYHKGLRWLMSPPRTARLRKVLDQKGTKASNLSLREIVLSDTQEAKTLRGIIAGRALAGSLGNGTFWLFAPIVSLFYLLTWWRRSGRRRREAEDRLAVKRAALRYDRKGG